MESGRDEVGLVMSSVNFGRDLENVESGRYGVEVRLVMSRVNTGRLVMSRVNLGRGFEDVGKSGLIWRMERNAWFQESSWGVEIVLARMDVGGGKSVYWRMEREAWFQSMGEGLFGGLLGCGVAGSVVIA